MTTTNKLNELLILCGINNIVFTYQKEEGGNYVNFNEPEKTIVVNVSDYEDKELDSLLDKKIGELKELFK
jgi:hypothetical protein